MKRVTKISLIAATVIVTVGAFSTINHFRDPESRAQWVVDEVTEELDLTEVQQTKLQEVRTEILATHKAAKQMLKESKDQFKALFNSTTLDQNQAVALIGSHTQFIDRQAPIVVAAFGGFYNSLSVQQQGEIREFMEKHDRRHYN